MVGANPKSKSFVRANSVKRPGASRHGLSRASSSRRLRWLALLATLVPISFTLAQCGKAPSAGSLAANVQGAGDTFDDRFPKPQFKDRFPTAAESFQQRPANVADAQTRRAVRTESYRVASLAPVVPYQRPAHEDQTALIGMKSSAFPYYGNNPRTEAPFLNVSNGERRGHRSYSGRVFWQDETFNDNRVLMHVPEHFDASKPGVIVVFFHGNGATLERDVRDRQRVPQQISESGANAVLLAPQLAVDAADSSAGKFWQPGGFKRFMDESVANLAHLYGDPASAKAFEKMPIVIVGYSGGFLPPPWSPQGGGISDRVRGVILLDAIYGELDKFANWIENHRNGFFVSSYTQGTASRNRELMRMLREKGIASSEDMNRPLRPGSVLFTETGAGIRHRDYVTQAWTKNPIEEVLVKMAAPSMRVASAPPSPNR